uniref:ZP domain-containing protein n=1 Tax=Strigamia maritima TaxID=126957 RepID=T1JIZ9_STRMM
METNTRIPIIALTTILIVSIITGPGLASTVEHKVFCTAKEMTVTVNLPDNKAEVYIDKLKGYPDCKPIVEGSKVIFHLSLEDIFTCGTTRVKDLKGRKIFYNRIVVEVNKTIKDKFRVKCEIHGRNLLQVNRRRRDVLPEGFVEPDDITITETVIGNGAFPELNVGVRQNGNYIDTQMNVQPGTPLEMEVYLDQNSSTTYGIVVTSMNVTDKTPGLREIIIYKGCSIDPYLFSNFEINKDSSVSAKFRAFKFPESSYVLFIGTVSICIDQCQGVPCSNGQIGYGRRKRDIMVNRETDIAITKEETYRDPNQIFEITMTTILQVNENEKDFTLSIGGIADNNDLPQIVIANENNAVDMEPLNADKDNSPNSSQCHFISTLLTIAVLLLLHNIV